MRRTERGDPMPGLVRLQQALDNHEEPADWPADVCRDAHCGHWERNGGRYYWHTPADHENADQWASRISQETVRHWR